MSTNAMSVGKKPTQAIGEYLANKVRNEFNAGIVKNIEVTGNESVKQLEGLELKRFQARVLIKKYAKKCNKIKSFLYRKHLTEKQCDFVKILVKQYKVRAAIMIERNTKR